MARHYSTRDFFRQMPNDLLMRFFQGREGCGGLDFSATSKAKQAEQFGAWLGLVETQRSAIEAEFREIFERSCE
jgi:hypothetical protein